MKLPGEIKKENWKTLSEGIKYRKIGTDVELNIYANQTLIFQNWQAVSVGQLPEGYRPKILTWGILFARNGTTGKEYISRFRINTDGTVEFLISTDTPITINIETSFIKFSVL